MREGEEGCCRPFFVEMQDFFSSPLQKKSEVERRKEGKEGRKVTKKQRHMKDPLESFQGMRVMVLLGLGVRNSECNAAAAE